MKKPLHELIRGWTFTLDPADFLIFRDRLVEEGHGDSAAAVVETMCSIYWPAIRELYYKGRTALSKSWRYPAGWEHLKPANAAFVLGETVRHLEEAIPGAAAPKSARHFKRYLCLHVVLGMCRQLRKIVEDDPWTKASG